VSGLSGDAAPEALPVADGAIGCAENAALLAAEILVPGDSTLGDQLAASAAGRPRRS